MSLHACANEEEKLIISIAPYNSKILHYKIIQHAKIFNRAIRVNPFISLSIATQTEISPKSSSPRVSTLSRLLCRDGLCLTGEPGILTGSDVGRSLPTIFICTTDVAISTELSSQTMTCHISKVLVVCLISKLLKTINIVYESAITAYIEIEESTFVLQNY